MIRHPDRIRALIAAIDRYDDDKVPELASPVHDALAVMRWLAALGVPWEQITLHVASRSPRREGLHSDVEDMKTRFVQGRQLERGAVRLLDARYEAIVESVRELLKPMPPASDEEQDAAAGDDPDRILVFLLGHGFQIPKGNELGSRVFITEEYTEGYTPNISVEHLAQNLQYVPGLRQAMIVFDACSVQPFGDNERATVTPGRLDHLQLPNLNPATGVAVCSASGQLELAQELPREGSSPWSVFLDALLELTHPDVVRNEFIDFDGEQPVLDLRAVMLHDDGVRKRVQASTGNAQNPELIPIGANTGDSVIPLYRLDLEIDRRKFLPLKALRAASRRNWVDTALDYRQLVTRARGLHHGADRFQEATMLVSGLPESPVRKPLLVGLASIEQDLRLVAETLSSDDLEPPGDVTEQLKDGRKAVARARESADLARAGADPMRPLATAGHGYLDGARALRLVVEAAYAKAVWEALGDVVIRTEALPADDAVRLLGQWAALADAPHLSVKADSIAERVGLGDGSLGLTLLKHHAHLEAVLWWMRERIDPRLTPIAGDLVGHLAAVRSELADTLLAGPTLQDAIRRLLEAYPAVSTALDGTILEALSRRATTYRRAAG